MKTDETIQNILMELAGMDNKPKMTDHLMNDLGMDSLDAVECIMEVEKEFNIAIPDEEAEKVQTVQELVDVVKRKTGEA